MPASKVLTSSIRSYDGYLGHEATLRGQRLHELLSRAMMSGTGPEYCDGMARERNRSGRIRDLGAKPVDIRTQTSKRERGNREVESAINAWDLLVYGVKATWRNRRACNPLSPTSKLYSPALIPSGLEAYPAKPPHPNSPIPLFKIPPAQWPAVLQQVAQGESLRQIARSYHTSYEAVRRVLNASRKGLVEDESEQSTLDAEHKRL